MRHDRPSASLILMRLTGAAVSDEQQPRPAAYLALLTKQTLDQTLYELRTLETEGQVRTKTDEAGVVRWELVPAESGAAMELGAEVWMADRYGPSRSQRDSLGLS